LRVRIPIPPTCSAGFGQASSVAAWSSEKPKDPPNKSAGFDQCTTQFLAFLERVIFGQQQE
jgi:hypothetical protein